MRADPNSWETIYTTYINDLFSYGKALGIEKDLLQDIIHDLFLHLIDNKPDLRSEEGIKFYLLRSLKNRFISELRKKKDFDELEAIDSYAFSIKVSAIDLMIEKEEQDLLISKVEKIMGSLTPRQREAIYLRYMQGFSYEEIAQILDIKEKGARKLVERAIKTVRDNHLSFSLFLLLLTK